MAFADWDFFTGGTVTNALQSTGALVGSSSLEIVMASGSRVQGQLDAGESRGFTKGKIRSLFKNTAVTGTASSVNVGLWCLSSVENMLGTGSGDAYAVGIYPEDSVTNVTLRKITQNLGEFLSTGTLLGSASEDFATATVALELEWNVAVAETGGVVLKVRTGSQTDYSDLSEVISIVDSSSPYTTGFAEGIFCDCDTGQTATFLIDNTEIFTGS